MAADEIYDVHSLLKSFRDNNYDTELAEIKDVLTEERKKSRGLTANKKEMSDKKKSTDVKIITLTKQLRKVEETADIEELENNKTSLKINLNKVDEKVGELKKFSEQYIVEERELEEAITLYKKNEIDKKYSQLEQYKLEKKNNQIEIDKLKIEVKNKLDKIEKLGNLDYDPKCKFCMSNPFTLDAMETKRRLNDDKALADKFVKESDSLVSTINNLSHITLHKEQMDECINQLSLVTSNISKVDSQSQLIVEKKKNLISQLSIVEDKINLYHEQEKDIVFNQNLQKDINDSQGRSDWLEIEIEAVDTKLTTVNGEVKVLETNRRNILSNIKKVEKLEGKYSAYQYYMDAIKRDGIPYELITKAIPTIEGAVNDILSQIVDFSMVLEMDGKNINCYIVYDDDNVWPLELSSGMERFISSLAMRVGLVNVSNLPAANFLAIDEGWGTMDSDNLNSVYNLFQYLKSQFQFTMIVSHIDSMRDAVDTLLEIKKENSFSNVSFD
jgi:DNA repair exonuclease SbcCD ATPase subunit